MDNRKKIVFSIILLTTALSITPAVNLSAQTSGSSSTEFYPLEAQKVILLSVAKQGIVRKIAHEPQDYVKKDDLLIQLDDDLVKLEISALEARIDLSTIEQDADIKCQYAKDNLEIVEKLYKEKIGGAGVSHPKELREAEQTYELAKSGIKNAELEMKLLRNALEQKKKELKLHSIKAPIDGVIVPWDDEAIDIREIKELKRIEVGEMVVPTQPAIVMMKIDYLKTRIFQPSSKFNAVRLGQSAKVYIEGAAEPIAATVVYKSPVDNYSLRRFNIEVEFKNPKLQAKDIPAGIAPFRFRPGMRARVELMDNR